MTTAAVMDGMEGGNAIQEPENGSHVDLDSSANEGSQQNSSDDGGRTDTITQGKQKARLVVAASGVNLESYATDSSPVPSSSVANGNTRRSNTATPISSPMPTSLVVARKRETPADKIALEEYVNREFDHKAVEAWNRYHPELIEQKRRERDYYVNLQQVRQQNPAAIFGLGYQGYGNGKTDLKPHPNQQIVYPKKKKRPGKRQTAELRIPRKELTSQAEQIEQLVPIRLDVEWDKIKLRDTFTWNLHDCTVPKELFAEYLVEDFQLAPSTHGALVRQITETLKEQLDDYHPHINFNEEPLDAHLPYSAYKNDEMRILIKLNLTVGQATLVDQFEWDLNNPDNCAEEFARTTAKENNLSGEFTTAIAHSIREQVQLFTKSLYITAHPFDGRPIEDGELKEAFLASPLAATFRPYQTQKDFMLYVYDLNEGDLEKTELSLSREQRRQKRSVNRRHGPALPDLKDRQRTIRTSIISSLFPGAAETLEESRIYKRSASSRNRRTIGGQRDGADDSGDSDSEASSPDSPAIPSHLLQGTARTRNMRGAASAAQAAMRAANSLGRSATPEASLHHHETRTSARRLGGRDYREDSADEPDKLIVKLKISKDKFRIFLRDPKGYLQRLQRSPFIKSQSGTPQVGTPTQKHVAPPHNPPSIIHSPAQRSQPNGAAIAAPGTPSQPAQQQPGVIDAPPHPPGPGNLAPDPPAWLTDGVAKLRERYPDDSFVGTMRYTVVDTTTGNPFPTHALQAGQQLPPHVKYQYHPRIRCFDCPGKLYTPGPGMTVESFEVHLKHRPHRDRVEARMNGSAA